MLSGVTEASRNGGSQLAARNESEPPMTPRQIIRPKGLERPSRASHGEGNRLRSLKAGDTVSGEISRRTLPGYRGRDVRTAGIGTGETLLGSLRGQEGVYKAEPKSHPAERESDEVIVPLTARTNNLAEGRTSTLIGGGETGRAGACPHGSTDSPETGRSIQLRSAMQARVVRANRPLQRSSVSRMPKSGTYGLKGRGW